MRILGEPEGVDGRVLCVVGCAVIWTRSPAETLDTTQASETMSETTNMHM